MRLKRTIFLIMLVILIGLALLSFMHNPAKDPVPQIIKNSNYPFNGYYQSK